MNPDEFYQSRREDWQALTQLLERSQRGLEHFSQEEVQALGRLYRAATSDLALAQRDFPNHRTTQYLNSLVAEAHALVYRSEPAAFKQLKEFVLTGFPTTYREVLPFTILAMLLLIVPAILSGIFVAVDRQAALWLLPEQIQELIPELENQELWTNIPVEDRPYTSTFIMQNNIRVTFLAFSAGILGGIFTAWVMVYNGLILGGLTGLTSSYGLGFELWTFVIGHGVIELSVIFMAGGTGLMLGWAVIHPGLLRRQDALVQAARKAIRLVVGGVPLLIIAGAIEGFISPAESIPWHVKWSAGILSGLILYFYLLFSGRSKARAAEG